MFITPGSRAQPRPLPKFLSGVLRAARGALMFRGSNGWSALAAGASGALLKSGGAGADPAFTGKITENGSQITVNYNAATLPGTLPTNTVMQVGGVDGTQTRSIVDSFGAAAQLVVRRANTSAASPSGVSSGDVIGSFVGLAHNNSAYITGGAASLRFYAAETWSSSANGTQAKLGVIKKTTTTLIDALSVEDDGGVLILDSSGSNPTGNSKGAGTLNVAGGLYVNGASVSGGGGRNPFTEGFANFGTVPTQAGTGFSAWMNQPTSSTVADDANGVAVFEPSQGANHTLAIIKKDVSGVSTPYQYDAAIWAFPDARITTFGGPVFGFSDGTKFNGLMVESSQFFGTSHTNIFANATLTWDVQESDGTPPNLTACLYFLRVKNDGTNLIFSTSRDGVHWRQIQSVAKGTNLSNQNWLVFGNDNYSVASTSVLTGFFKSL
jgi:hypothetical protein